MGDRVQALSRRQAWLVLGVALAARLTTAGFAWARDPGALIASDSEGYVALAHGLLDQGRFQAPGETLGHTRRTPGLPLLIAAVYALCGERPEAAVLVGVLLSAATAWLTAATAAALAGPVAGLAAGLLLALDTASIVGCHQLLTEPAFTFLLAAATLCAVRGPQPGLGSAGGSGLLLAAAVLTRPVGLVLILPFAAWVAALAAPGRRARTLGAFVIPFVVLVGGWQVRNGLVAGAYTPSHGPAKFLLLSRGSDIVSQRDGLPFRAARTRLETEVETAPLPSGRRRESLYLDRALELFTAHPGLLLWTQVRWLPELMLGTGAAGLTARLGLAEPGGQTVSSMTLSAAAAMHLLLLYVGTGLALRDRLWSSGRTQRTVAGLAALILALVLASTGPQGYSRLRVPFAPLLAVLAGVGLSPLVQRPPERQ
ncbi:MAG: glycosyltransferase family 39 protein [Vicinamibacteria bacterium]|nr:glycosyltransferase family 39 protein [Vicinamibacteria bacterium]